MELNTAIKRGENVLLEGTQGFGISLYYGTYPFVTSKDTSASQIAADNGVGPTRIDDVVVVFKAYPTRVGEGPFLTEMDRSVSDRLGIQEFGTVTHRQRRIGQWDGDMARYSAMINGYAGCDNRYRPGRQGLFRSHGIRKTLSQGTRVFEDGRR